MTFFLERGADFIGDLSFAHAFHERIRTALGVYLDRKRRWPELAPQLQEQADVALRQHCHDGNMKWVSLLMWAGADPTSTGPTIEYLNDDPEMYTTVLAEACSRGNLDVLKWLKPDPLRDDLGGLLRHAASSACCRGEVLRCRRSVRLGGHECEGTKIRTTPPRYA